MEKVTIGNPVDSLPGGTLNELIEFVEWAKRVGLFRRPDALPPPSAPAQVTITVKNTTAANLNFGAVLGCDDPLDTPNSGADNGNQYRRPVFTGVAPDATNHASKFVILQSSANADGGAEGLKIGLTPVKVYVNDAAHKFAKVKGGDTSQLESATAGPAEIWWKESGTGTKWALVLLGGGGGGGGSADSGVYVFKVTTEIPAATDERASSWGIGSGKIYDFNTGRLTETEHDLYSMHPQIIPADSYVKAKLIFVGDTINEAVYWVDNFSCYEYPWYVEA